MGDAGDEVRDGRRRRLVVRALVVVAVLVVGALLLPTPVVDGLAAGPVSRLGGDCAELVGVDVHSGRWPVIGRLVAGRYEDVAADIDEIRLPELGLAYHDVRFTATRVEVGTLGGLLDDEVWVHEGAVAATLRFATMEAALRDHGVTAELTEQAGSVRAEVEVPLLGTFPTTVHVVPAGTAVELELVPLDAFSLPPVPVELPAPAEARAVVVDDEGVHVDAAIEGRLPAADDDAGCTPAA
jgi:hypothetical protein